MKVDFSLLCSFAVKNIEFKSKTIGDCEVIGCDFINCIFQGQNIGNTVYEHHHLASFLWQYALLLCTFWLDFYEINNIKFEPF